MRQPSPTTARRRRRRRSGPARSARRCARPPSRGRSARSCVPAPIAAPRSTTAVGCAQNGAASRRPRPARRRRASTLARLEHAHDVQRVRAVAAARRRRAPTQATKCAALRAAAASTTFDRDAPRRPCRPRAGRAAQRLLAGASSSKVSVAHGPGDRQSRAFPARTGRRGCARCARRRNAASPTARCPRPQAPDAAAGRADRRRHAAEQVQGQRDVVRRQRPPGAARPRGGPARRAPPRNAERLAQHAVGDRSARPPDRRVVQQQVPDRQHAPPRGGRRVQLAARRTADSASGFSTQGAGRPAARASRPRGGAGESTATATAATSGSASTSSRSAGQPRARGAPARARRAARRRARRSSAARLREPRERPCQRQAPGPGADQRDSDGVHGRRHRIEPRYGAAGDSRTE